MIKVTKNKYGMMYINKDQNVGYARNITLSELVHLTTRDKIKVLNHNSVDVTHNSLLSAYKYLLDHHGLMKTHAEYQGLYKQILTIEGEKYGRKNRKCIDDDNGVNVDDTNNNIRAGGN